jgi:hypothetical protein
MDLTISSPCPKRWDELIGDERIRYCGHCQLNVYNLTVMTPPEINQLLHRTNGRLCVRMYVRNDRTATLRDCPVGRENVVRRRIRAITIAFSVLVFGLISRSLRRPEMSDWPQWVQVAARWVDLDVHPFRQPVVGALPPRRLPVVPTPPPPVSTNGGTDGTP